MLSRNPLTSRLRAAVSNSVRSASFSFLSERINCDSFCVSETSKLTQPGGRKGVRGEWHCRLRFDMLSAQKMSVRGTGHVFLPDTVRLLWRDSAFLA